MDDFNDWLDDLRDLYHERKTWARVGIGLIVAATITVDQLLSKLFGA